MEIIFLNNLKIEFIIVKIPDSIRIRILINKNVSLSLYTFQ
jgi:hypothetical protein